MRRRFVALLGVTVSGATFPAISDAVSFAGIGILPGGSGSEAHAISADGTVVVGASAGQAIRWTSGGGMVGLGVLPGGTSSFSGAFGVSADGSVVVGQNVSENEFGSLEFQSFRWTSGGGMVGLGFLPGGTGFNGAAVDVSADGSVAVGFSDSAAFFLEPYRWTEGTGMVGLGVEGFANGVSDDGAVVVGGAGEAFRWTEAGGVVGLGILPGGNVSEALDASADGSVVVGGSGFGFSAGEAFRWTASEGMIGLGVLPGATGSLALAVSADGSVVVGASSDAFIWDAAHGMRSLRSLLLGAGIDLTGWSLGNAEGISADGLTIVGTGANPSGQSEGWIAFLPEPGTPLLVLTALLALARRARASGCVHAVSGQRGPQGPRLAAQLIGTWPGCLVRPRRPCSSPPA